MVHNPLISIIIPIYNGSNYVIDAIESALKQTYQNIEIIVVNDGSKDEGATFIAIKPYLDLGKIKYLEKENGGVSSALNFGIIHAEGEYIAWLSHDDLFSFKKIEHQVKCLLKGDEMTIPYTDVLMIDKDGKREKHRLFVKNRKSDFDSANSFFPYDLCFASSLLPRLFLIEHPFNELARYTQDVEMFYTFLKYGYKFKHVKDAYYLMRVHNQRVTVTSASLFDKDIYNFHQLLMVDINESKNYIFVKKYLYFASEKKGRYPIYSKIYYDLEQFLKSNKKYSFYIKLKSCFISLFAHFAYKLRMILLNR